MKIISFFEVSAKVLGCFLFIFVCCAMSFVASAESSYTLFEAGQVRPLALSSDGRTLFALNTPDGRLEIFKVRSRWYAGKRSLKLIPEASILVGLEPVALAVRSHSEVWVVNHLSDSVSIVKLGGRMGPHVAKTLLVGDEPRDIVFAGYKNSKAFITTAHRGQNHPNDPQITTPGVGRADVWVYDAKQASRKNVKPLNIITLFTDTPRALAVSQDKTKVYAAGFKTGNKTTTINEIFIPNGGVDNGGLPSTRVDVVGEAQPETGLIVKFDGQHWLDELGRVWDDKVNFNLPDKDVFVIDAMSNPPQTIDGEGGFYTGVGTVLFNMIANPVSGAVYVTNSEARNESRFEGPGTRLGRENTVQGNFVRHRISVLKQGEVSTRHLNKHIDYGQCCDSIPNNENALSIAQPQGMAITNDGNTLYVAGFGSQKVMIYDTQSLEDDSFMPDLSRQIPLSGGGPAGLVLNERRGLLFVLTRFDNAIAVIDLHSRQEIAKSFMFNPEPDSVVAGRRFLYDASLTSSHGDSSCGSCHIFGDFDSLAWDLGDPDSMSINNPGPFAISPEIAPLNNADFRALKGPMTTQSLRGLANHGAMHWRGDRTGGNDESSAQPDLGTFNEDLAFKKFNIAFEGLNGRSEALSDDEMQAFTDFILQLTYPPNPIRQLDNSLTAEQQAGKDIYFSEMISDNFSNCNSCHVLDPDANAEFDVAKPGFFGTDGRSTFDSTTQFFKTPHLRNLYQKVGMFGLPPSPPLVPGPGKFFVDDDPGFMGDQIRGFGFLHDGSSDTAFRFFGGFSFVQTLQNPGGFPRVPEFVANADQINAKGNQMRRDMEAFMMAFDANLAPIVGQQVTLSYPISEFERQRATLFKERAEVGECDLIFSRGNRTAFYQMQSESSFERWLNRQIKSPWYRHRGPTTLLCAPPGSGQRIGWDRDEDGLNNHIECLVGSDPADANSNIRQGKKYGRGWQTNCRRPVYYRM